MYRRVEMIHEPKIIKACQRTGQEYRVLKVKENAVEPLYKDDVQVVVRPRRKHH